MKYALISQRQMIEIESAFETKRLFATVKDIEVIDKALKILHLLKFSDAVGIIGAELAKPEQEPFKPDWVNYRQGLADGAAQPEQELAKPEQEPIGWFLKDHLETYMESYKDIEGAIPLYTAPPRKEWVGLSINEGRDFFESKLTRAELIAEISEFLEEKNNAV